MSTQDRVRLSARERQQLASIQAMLEAADPELAKALRGQAHPGWAAPGHACPPCRCQRQPGVVRIVQTWTGPVTVLLGLVLIFVTISSQTWLSVLGALVVGAGLELCVMAWRKRHPLPQRPVRRTVPD
jgi:hypothetical protein